MLSTGNHVRRRQRQGNQQRLRNFQQDVSFTTLQGHIRGLVHFLEQETFGAGDATDNFFRDADGMRVASCTIKGHPHWIAYDGWRGVLYEPLNDELVCIDHGDLVPDEHCRLPRIKAMLGALGIDHLSQFYQLWDRASGGACRGPSSREENQETPPRPRAGRPRADQASSHLSKAAKKRARKRKRAENDQGRSALRLI